ncbi:23459_t:CDS:2 [Cetraspora pellucida]|uniref:23459_t:CDS:1 n=1 Tax=Cetraspora pellucida TaxID=1433469 RepID=A0A9N9NDE4_9GLOM|nr:23459_t:CDS:2 [Cetraspora pellucida]
MAEARCLPILKYVSTLLNPIPQYMGQMPPSDYCDMIIQTWAPAIPNMMALENANAEDFDDAVKVKIIKGKMAGKYASVPPQNNFVNPAVNIDSPDTLRAWLNAKYQRETVGTSQSAILRLSQERFQPFDNPDIYETRIRPLLLVFPSYDEIQKSFQAMLEKQKAESKAEIEKLKTEFESKISQQSKKSRSPILPKDHEQIYEFYADQRDPRWSNLSREEALQWLDKAFPPLIASKPERLRLSNQNARIDRIESKVDEIGQITSQFGRMMLDNKKPYTDVPVSVKDKNGKIVTATGNFACINNGEPEPMLCLVQDILDPNKNQFRMKLHGKTYTIPTFSKATEVNEPEQQVSDMYNGKVLAERCSQLTKAKTGI